MQNFSNEAVLICRSEASTGEPSINACFSQPKMLLNMFKMLLNMFYFTYVSFVETKAQPGLCSFTTWSQREMCVV